MKDVILSIEELKELTKNTSLDDEETIYIGRESLIKLLRLPEESCSYPRRWHWVTNKYAELTFNQRKRVFDWLKTASKHRANGDYQKARNSIGYACKYRTQFGGKDFHRLPK